MKNNNSNGGDETRMFTPLNTENNKNETQQEITKPRQGQNTGQRPAQLRQGQHPGQGQTRPAQFRQGQNNSQGHPNQLRQVQRPAGQGQTRPAQGQHSAGQVQNRQSARPTGQNQPSEQSRTKYAGQDRLRRPAENDNNQTRTIQTVQPAQNGMPKNTDSAGHMKTIYKKDEMSQRTTVINTVSPGSARTPGNGNKTRIMNAVVPANGQNTRQNVRPTAAVPYRGKGQGPGRRPPNRGYNDDGGGEAVTGALTSVMKAIIYIVFVLVVSGFLSYFGISICNDVFAFVKSDDETEIIIPEYATLNDIADILRKNDIISYPSIFKMYAKLRRDSGEYLPGVYTVTPSMNYDMLLSDFKPKPKPRAEVSVTIPEGYTVDQIIEIFLARDMGTREGFIDVIENGDFSEYNLNWFVTEIDKNRSPDRKYRLEGYLFPDTYYFYSDSSEKTIIYKMLRNFYNKFDESYKTRCEELGYTVDQVITLASMIQAEAKYASEYTLVSSVFHNRLNSPSGPTQGRLESDPTVLYYLENHQGMLTQADTRTEHPYNTYIHKGLPPGPICNPSLNAIQYALYPSETNYLFFVAKRDGYHLFAATFDEHNMNRIAAGSGS